MQKTDTICKQMENLKTQHVENGQILQKMENLKTEHVQILQKMETLKPKM
jgi:hypothetical protein